jgi:hypothetical protein
MPRTSGSKPIGASSPIGSAGRFSASDVDALDRAQILGVRSGPTHKYTGVWVVVVEGRVFVRSWNDKPTGWYRALRKEPLGMIALGGRRGVEAREIPVRARPVRSARLRDAVTAAYARKYHTPASQKWVRGFAETEREATTLELVPL